MASISLPDRSAVGFGEREAGRRKRLADLREGMAELRARMMAAKGEYDAGRLSLDEELRLIRHIERALVALETQMHDEADPRPSSMFRMIH